jgi:transposase
MDVVTTFQVSLASLKRWIAAQRDTGDLAPQPPTGGPKPYITSALDEALCEHVAAFPDATLAEHTQRWNTVHTMSLSPSTMGRAIRRLQLTRKKRV